MAAAEHKSDIELTKDTPYVAFTSELWGVCWEDLGENWPHYNGTALYHVFLQKLPKVNRMLAEKLMDQEDDLEGSKSKKKAKVSY